MAPNRILIVEDEIISATFLKKELQTAGYDIVGVVCNGADAIAVSLDKQPDLILMDIYLADNVNGIDAVKEIHKSADIPVIYLTASTDPMTFKTACDTEFVEYINKPYIFSKLAGRIESVLSPNSLSRKIAVL